MDQHEKDWLDLGRQLKNYHPVGDPDEAFRALQELQQQQPARKKKGAGLWLYDNLLLLVLLPFLALIAYSVGKGQWERYQDKAAVQEMNIVEIEAQTQPAGTSDVIKDQTSGPENTASSPISSFKEKPSDQLIKVEEVPQNSRVLLPEASPLATNREIISGASDAAPRSETAEPTSSVALLPNQAPGRVEVTVLSLPSRKISPIPWSMPDLPASTAVITQQPAHLQVTLGTGLSNHWRGANFMQEVDRGIYAYVGIYRRLGQRIGLEGRIGYRGHGMRMPVFSDVDAPWSYHKEEIHNTGHMGEDRAYVYEGVVEGYQAVEFSLLANYQLSSKLNINAGVRYSLPDLAFERTVVGPDDENPFFEFIAGRSLVKYQDYGALFGAEYHFSRHLAIEAGLHLGMVDLIDDAAAGSTRFNHSSSLSFGVKYKLE